MDFAKGDKENASSKMGARERAKRYDRSGSALGQRRMAARGVDELSRRMGDTLDGSKDGYRALPSPASAMSAWVWAHVLVCALVDVRGRLL